MFAAQCLWSGAMTAAAKGEVLYYRRLYCAFVHCGLLDQASPWLTYMPKINIISLSRTHKYLVCVEVTPQFVRVRQVAAGLVVWLVINRRPNKEQTGNEWGAFLYIYQVFSNLSLDVMSASAIFCSIPDTFHKLYFFLFFHWMNRRKILQWIFTGELFQLVYQTPQSKHPRWCKNKLHNYIVETVLTTQASSYLYFCAPKLNSPPVRLASPG